jgi:hypothetical protein
MIDVIWGAGDERCKEFLFQFPIRVFKSLSEIRLLASLFITIS